MTAEEVAEKIRKCVRLALRGATEGERAAAANRAKALAEAHGLDVDGIDEDTPIPVEVADEKTHTRTGIEQPLATKLIQEHFGVDSFWRTTRGTKRQRVVWVGERVNIPIAQQIYLVATRAARRAWEERKRQDEEACRAWNLELRRARWVDRGGVMFSETPLPPRPVCVTRGRDARKQFMVGFFEALDATLAARPLRNDGKRLMAERGANALHIRKLEMAGKFGAPRRSDAGHFNWVARQAGVADGSRVSLNRPVDGAARPTLRLAAGT
ncbi:MAG: DUF2786 domain-containing protein [Kiritimatiellae bacterium]|nr:DUF2786 domain-containing protein [Kiritimatiellia bacterium]